MNGRTRALRDIEDPQVHERDGELIEWPACLLELAKALQGPGPEIDDACALAYHRASCELEVNGELRHRRKWMRKELSKSNMFLLRNILR